MFRKISPCCATSHDPTDSVEHLSEVCWRSSSGFFFFFCDIQLNAQLGQSHALHFQGFLISRGLCHFILSRRYLILQILDSELCSIDLIQDSIQHVFDPLQITQDAGTDFYLIGQRCARSMQAFFFNNIIYILYINI